MDQAGWVLNDGVLGLQSSSGADLTPTAQEIWSSEFRALREIQGLCVVQRPSESVPRLRISRFPAEVEINIFEDVITGNPAIALQARCEAGSIPIPPGADQVVHDEAWYPLDIEQLEGARKWLCDIGITEFGTITWGQLVRLRVATNPPVSINDRCHVTATSLAALTNHNIGAIAGLQAELYPYQRDGIAFLNLIAAQELGCVLADEMGLGKTLQVIGLLQCERNRDDPGALIICPSTIVENWRRELALFAPTLSVYTHTGSDRAGLATNLLPFDVVITSYDIAVRDQLLLSEKRWNIVVADEAQAIKNPMAQRTVAVKRIPRRVSIAVTGTPVENHLDDLWSISDFVLPGLLGPIGSFRANFTDDLDDAGKLAPVVAPILLRRRVADVAKDLPPKIEIPQPIVMGQTLAQTYEKLRKETLDEYGPAGGLVATTRLRTLCTHPSLNGAWNRNPEWEFPKYTRLLEILEEVFLADQKALVFTTYQAMTDLLMRDIPTRWPNGFFGYIDGRVDISKRQPLIDEFYAWSGYGCLFLNPKAAGAGLNITAASHVIHYNPEWNPALTDQASRRAFRRKQQLPVTIHHFFYADSIEEVILQRAQFKRELAESSVTGHDGVADPELLIRALQISPIARYERSEEA